MKKSLIAVAGASVATAAMPVVGAFAATTTTNLTDVVTVNVEQVCVVTPHDGSPSVRETVDGQGNVTRTLADNIIPAVTIKQGTYASNIGSSNGPTVNQDDPADDPDDHGNEVYVDCPGGKGGGSGTPGVAADTWKLTAIGASEGSDITAMKGGDASHSIPTGSTWDGSDFTTSVWQYKVIGSTGVANYSAIPGSVATVATSSPTATGATLKMRYRVKASNNQDKDTYVGKVTYTLTYVGE